MTATDWATLRAPTAKIVTDGGNSLVQTLSKAQYRLVSTRSKFPAFVGGFGSGKTEALVQRALLKKFAYFELNNAYYMPTFDLIRKTAWPRFEEKLSLYQVSYKLNKQDNEISIEDGGKIIFRTMDTPARIIAYEVADSEVDELDTLTTLDAREVWRRIISRNRQKKPNGDANTVAVGTTPEGFRFVYEQWAKNQSELTLASGYELIRASSHSNAANLPENYIADMMALYPSSLIAAYIDGEFVNLTSGSIYGEFDRKLNSCDTKIRLPAATSVGEILYIGMDFNVSNMSGIVFVKRDGDPHAVTELTKILDTPAMIDGIKRRFPGHRICVYPDASGASRKSNNASVSDISLLRGAGFDVYANPANPAVKDRILSVNALIHSGGRRRLKINVEACPAFVETLEKQAYDKKGEPDKTTGLDHAGDAGGYFLCYEYPIKRRDSQRMMIVGV